MEQLKSTADLLDLHDIDLQIDRLLDDRNSLPELETYRIAHATVDRLTSDLAQARALLKATELSLDKSNGELGIVAEKASAEQNRLYAGGLSARDADYMRREVEMLHAKVRGIEDEVLALMEQRETVEGTVDAITVELADASEEKNRLTGIIQERWRVIDKEIALKEERKAAAIRLVDDNLLEVYEDLRSRSSGRVVGRLTDGICGACHLQLSAAEVVRVAREDPPRCIHCRAILVI